MSNGVQRLNDGISANIGIDIVIDPDTDPDSDLDYTIVIFSGDHPGRRRPGCHNQHQISVTFHAPAGIIGGFINGNASTGPP
jgi:hypothetical protein